MIATAYGRTQTGVLGTNFVWRYWFRPGGEISLGICRIAIFSALLHALSMNYRTPSQISAQLSTISAVNYIPKGILKLFSILPLDATIMTGVWWVALVTCIMAIVGVATRPAMVIATLSTLSLLSLRESFGPFWSHGYNVNACAALAIMLAPAGATLSVDRIARKATGWWPFGRDSTPTSYYWGVLAAQIAVAFFYFAAFYAKMYYGGLWWAFSDNMRIMLAITWEHPYAAWDIPWRIQTLMSHPLLWKAAAVVHLLTQALPILAAFHMRHPVLRLAEGGIFVGGVYGLYLVMTVWDPQWFWLGAVFVDWEWLLTKARGALERFRPAAAGVVATLLCRAKPWLVPMSYVPGTHGANPPPWPIRVGNRYPRAHWAALIFLTVFLGYYAWVFVFQLARQHLNYPFSNFDFYATNYAHPPYHENKHYTFMAGGIRLRAADCSSFANIFDGDHPVFKCADGVAEYTRESRQSGTLYEYYRALTHDTIAGALSAIRADADLRFPGVLAKDTRIDLLIRLWQYPAYPLPVAPKVSLEMLRGVQLADGRTLSAVGNEILKGRYDRRIQITATGFVNPAIELRYYHDAWYGYGQREPVKLPGRWLDDRTIVIDSDTIQFPAFTEIVVRDGEEAYGFWGPILYK